jgi:hypothetical protein
VFVFLTHEAAGASTPGIPHALEFFQGDRLTHTSGAPRRENAEACLVIARSDATKQSITVVPAKAGTHTPRPLCVNGSRRLCSLRTPVVMGPCFRRDDI